MKKVYYHVSFHIDKIIKTFQPKVPTSSLPTEDIKIPRVCICENIHECLNGMAYASNYMYMESYNSGLTDYAMVRVYEFEIDENEIVKSEDIVKYVPDAIRTKELWSLKEITPIRNYLILPTFLYQKDTYPYDIFEFEYEDEAELRDMGLI